VICKEIYPFTGMRSNLLFPPAFRIIGAILLLPGLVLGYLFEYHHYILSFLRYGNNMAYSAADNFTDEVATSLIIIGGLLVGFSRFKNEQKPINKIRLFALYWAVLLNLLLVSVSNIVQLIPGLLEIEIVRNISFFISQDNSFLLLLIFLCRFYYLLYRYKADKKIIPLFFFPYQPYNRIGKIASIPFIMLVFVEFIFSMAKINSFGMDFDMILLIGFPVFLLIWIGSKEKNEIAFITQIRIKSMQIALYINMILFLAATWSVYGLAYFTVMYVASVSWAIIFLMIFYYQLFIVARHHKRNAPTNVV